MKFAFAQKQDLPAIQHFLALAELPYSDITLAHLPHFLLMWADGELAGTVGLEIYEHHALLRSLAVHPDHQGQGFGDQLVSRIEQYAQTHAIQTLYLLTTTVEHFFRARGYIRTERKKVPAPLQQTSEFQELCPDSAVCLRKNIKGQPK